MSAAFRLTTSQKASSEQTESHFLPEFPAYILSDHSKFDQITSVTFTDLDKVIIITDKLSDKKYLTAANIKEVM